MIDEINAKTDKQNGDEDKKQPRANVLVRFLRDFGDKTTCHGVKRAFDLEGFRGVKRLKNLAWMLILGASIGMAVSSLMEIFADFSSHPVSTAIDINFKNSMPFPSVTICNLNFAIWDRIHWKKQMRILRIWEDYVATESMTEDEEKLDDMKHILRFASFDEKIKSGHNLREMLIECNFNGGRCTSDDFKLRYNDLYGNCYSFNTEFRFKRKEEMQRAKRSSVILGQGLKLVIDVQHDKYLALTETAGVKVLIHDQGEVPFPEHEGIVAATGFSTYVGLSRFDIHRLEAPYGRCLPIDGEHSAFLNIFAGEGFGYSEFACVKTCFQRRVVEKCGCCDPMYPCDASILSQIIQSNNSTTNFSDIQLCSLRDSTQFVCLVSVYEEASTDSCGTECPPACDKKIYAKSYSLSRWPSEKKTGAVFDRIGGTDRFGNMTLEEQNIRVRDNVLSLNIHFESNSVLNVRTQPAYTWISLLCDVGGQLGLWLGCSALTAVEIVELILEGFLRAVLAVTRCFSQMAPFEARK